MLSLEKKHKIPSPPQSNSTEPLNIPKVVEAKVDPIEFNTQKEEQEVYASEITNSAITPWKDEEELELEKTLEQNMDLYPTPKKSKKIVILAVAASIILAAGINLMNQNRPAAGIKKLPIPLLPSSSTKNKLDAAMAKSQKNKDASVAQLNE
ncbi:MAG: hypothetical protein R3B45_02950 [Bdellovibrionota bacterium]